MNKAQGIPGPTSVSSGIPIQIHFNTYNYKQAHHRSRHYSSSTINERKTVQVTAVTTLSECMALHLLTVSEHIAVQGTAVTTVSEGMIV